MNNTPPAVELVDIWKHFNDATALHGVNLTIDQGEFFSLLGPSGCGKTTSLRMIAGFEQPSQGMIRLLGREISQQPPNRRNVNMVFQNYALFPHMSVFDNVAFGLQARRQSRGEIAQRVEQYLALVQLSGLEKRKPNQLSGGQQQRVALARALVNQPAVLLLDEPLGALDQKLRKAMQLELKRLQRELGITFIYVTHDQEEALTMSDRIAVMNQGRVLQVAAPRLIYASPATRFVADFIGLTNFLPATVCSMEGEMAVVEVDGLGFCRAPCVDGLTAGQHITLAIRPEQMHLSSSTGREHDNHAAGTLEEIIFVGNDTQFIVRLDAGQHLMVRQQNQTPPSMDSDFLTGQPVHVYWAAASTSILLE
jgi:spermidine/putrescine transport system ATP-binding protein